MGSTNDIVRAVMATSTFGLSEVPLGKGVTAGDFTPAGIMAQSGRAIDRTVKGMGSAAGAAKDAANAQRKQAQDLANEAAARRKEEIDASAVNASAQAQRSKQKASMASGAGRRSTILTGPLGAVDAAPVARKTILGA